MPRKELPRNYYYFAEVHYQNGTVKPWRFVNKTLRRSAIAAFKKDSNVKRIFESEGFA